MSRILHCVAHALALVACLFAKIAFADFNHDTDLSLRIDDSTDRAFRTQYRLRFEPEWKFSERWSLHGYIATGDSYDSAYNTFQRSDDEINLRRAFTRYAGDGLRVEAGVLPPYKGRVSSTGLSKEGWVKGLRAVFQREAGQLEFVAGELESLDADSVFERIRKLNYFELEYSLNPSDGLAFELSAEHMLDDSFLRGEIRLLRKSDRVISGEYVHNIDEQGSKLVFSYSDRFSRPSGDFTWFSYYSYVSASFGDRAELAEDFLDVGHAIATRLSAPLLKSPSLKWFVRLEVYEKQTRGMLGIQWSID